MANPLNVLIPEREAGSGPQFRWATVLGTSSSILVQLDGDTVPLASRPSMLVEVATGDRVLCLVANHRVVVLGRVGGDIPGPVWQSWEPTLVGTTGPTMGNSTRAGRYLEEYNGTVIFGGTIVIGSSFSAGSGFYSMPLPIPARTAGGLEWTVDLHVVGVSVAAGNGEGLGSGKIEGDGLSINRLYVRRNDATAGNLTILGGALTWGTGDKILVSGTYERA